MSTTDWDDLDDAMIEDIVAPLCPICHWPCERVECGTCGGEGGRGGEELMEEDPLWYDEDDWEDCGDCGGKGYHWQCPNEGQATP